MKYEQLLLSPSESLAGVDREWHTRKQGAYIVFDRHGHYIILSQRLPLIAAFLNAMASDGAEKVSVSALHQIVGTSANRVCGYSKNRWKLSFCKLDEVGKHFERARSGFDKAMIIGSPSAYHIVSTA